jgi:hypothetical protein
VRFQSAHSRLLEELIEEQKRKVMTAMTLGAKKTLYHQLVGQLKGLDDALALSQEADSKLNGDHIADR